MQKRVVIGAVLAIIVLAAAIIVFVYHKPSSPKPIAELNLSEDTTVLMADSGNKVYVDKLMQYLADVNESSMYLGPEYFTQCKAQKRAIIMGTKESKTKDVIAGLAGENFDEDRKLTLIKEDAYFKGQQFIIYYAPTDGELEKMIEDSISQGETTVRDTIVTKPVVFPQEPLEITGNVVTCEPEYTLTLLDFSNAIFNNEGFYLDTGLSRFEHRKYLRLQIYEPFSSLNLKDLIPKPGYEGFKDYVMDIVDDLKEVGIVKVTAKCQQCGQTYGMVYKASDFSSVEMMAESWVDHMRADMCTDCTGSNVTLSIEPMNMTEAAQDFIEDRISPESMMNKIVGKTDDVYDSLPKSYTYKVICPDDIPKIVVAALLPVYVDKDGNIIEYTLNLTTLTPNINPDDIASYSVPVSFNPLVLPSPVYTIWYHNTPEYDIYYALNVSSSPEGLIDNERIFYTGIRSLQAMPLLKKGDKMYQFVDWRINRESYRQTNTIFLKGWYANVVAEYKEVFDESAPAQQGMPDLAVRYANATEEGDTLKIDFIIRNEGDADVDSGFETNMLFNGVAMDKVSYNGDLPAGQSIEVKKEYDLLKLFEGIDPEYTVGASVDPADYVKESNENNNKFTMPMQRSKADLVFTGIEVSPDEPKKGDEISVDVSFENAGDRRINEAKVTLESGYEKWGTQYIVILDPGKNGSLTFSKSIDRCGKYSLTARFSDVDPKDEQQSNNWYKSSFKIDCEENSCGDQEDPYSCAGSTCESGTSCIWDREEEECTCSDAVEKTCLQACQPALGICNRDCSYPDTYHQEIGDSWCENDRMSDEYMCCCNLEVS